MNTGRAEVPGPIPKKLYKAGAKLFLPFLDPHWGHFSHPRSGHQFNPNLSPLTPTFVCLTFAR